MIQIREAGRGGRTRTRDVRFWRPVAPCAVRPICGPMRCAPRPQVPGQERIIASLSVISIRGAVSYCISIAANIPWR